MAEIYAFQSSFWDLWKLFTAMVTCLRLSFQSSFWDSQRRSRLRHRCDITNRFQSSFWDSWSWWECGVDNASLELSILFLRFLMNALRYRASCWHVFQSSFWDSVKLYDTVTWHSVTFQSSFWDSCPWRYMHSLWAWFRLSILFLRFTLPSNSLISASVHILSILFLRFTAGKSPISSASQHLSILFFRFLKPFNLAVSANLRIYAFQSSFWDSGAYSHWQSQAVRYFQSSFWDSKTGPGQ